MMSNAAESLSILTKVENKGSISLDYILMIQIVIICLSTAIRKGRFCWSIIFKNL